MGAANNRAAELPATPSRRRPCPRVLASASKSAPSDLAGTEAGATTDPTTPAGAAYSFAPTPSGLSNANFPLAAGAMSFLRAIVTRAPSPRSAATASAT